MNLFLQEKRRRHSFARNQLNEIPTELSMTSRMSFFNDRILQPEGIFDNLSLVMRAMLVFYLGSSPLHLRFDSDYFLSPVLTPEDLLQDFPPTFFLTGEKDPFVDDTLIFSSKLRTALRKNGKHGVRVKILEGISHGFLLMPAILPMAVEATKLSGEWLKELFDQGSDWNSLERVDQVDLVRKRRHETFSI
jgi:acetyl esterase/lipase